METSSALYKLVQRVKDSKFSIDNLHHYNLLLQFGKKDFQLCVTDPRKNQCLLLEDYLVSQNQEGQLNNDALKEIFDGHHLLMAGFWSSVKVSFKSDLFSFVPNDYFDKTQLNSYLRLNGSRKEGEDLHYYKHLKSDAVNIFVYQKKFLDWLSGIYKKTKVQVYHYGSAFIEGVLHHDDHSPGKTMFIMYDKGILYALVTENRKMVFYNQFKPKDLKSLLKTVLLVMKAMKMSQESSKVLVWGNVNTESNIFKGLYKYIRHVSLGGKPSFLKYNFMFDEVADHRYFGLFSLNLCQ